METVVSFRVKKSQGYGDGFVFDAYFRALTTEIVAGILILPSQGYRVCSWRTRTSD